MAINVRQIKGNTKKTTNNSETLINASNNIETGLSTSENTPDILATLPENNPDHQSSPDDFHETSSNPGWKLWSNFEEAKIACSSIYLKRGEAHTEFYKDENDEYHCVVAIGNLIPNTDHLFLTDSGSEYSIDGRLDQMNSSIIDLSKQVTYYAKKVKNLNSSINEFEDNVNSTLNQIEQDITNFERVINTSIAKQNILINNINTFVHELAENITDQVEDLSTFISRFDTRITENENNIVLINTSISDIKEQIDLSNVNIDNISNCILDINASIGNINSQIAKQNNNISDINASISRLNTSVNILETLQQNTSSKISEIDIALVDVNTSINEIKTNITDINSTISQNIDDINCIKTNINTISRQLDKDGRNILDISNNIININSSIREVKSELIDLNNNISTIRTNLQNESVRNDRQDLAINSINSSIDYILETMRCKCADIQKEIERNNIQDVSIWDLYSLINNIQTQLDEFIPIEESNIYPLFRDDIYTINLCCYSYGGHIEIYDYIAGREQGGYNNRVADCTPFNEYKTYIHGDKVFFNAVANPGYKFVCWYINGNIDSPVYTQSISYVFGDDINVIGSLLDGIEPDMLTNGYTAKFKKLHQLKVSINQITNNPETVAQYFNDTLEIYITEPRQTRRKIDIEDAIAGNVFYDDGTKFQITAKPDTEAFHAFNKYLISDGIHAPEEFTNGSYTNLSVTTDLIVDAYFMEYWITVSGAEDPQQAGRVYINGNYKQIAPDNTTYYLGGSEVTISATAYAGYGFNIWSSNKPTLSQFKNDILPYTVQNNLIKLNVNRNVNEYELVAYFNSGVNTHRVDFYTDDSYLELFATAQYDDGEIVYAPANEPVKPGYAFDEWVCEDSQYIINESEIDKDLRFYANWRINSYDVSFYSKGELYEKLENIEYNTPFASLGVYYPDNISTGETFMGWMVNSYVINPNTYHIQGYTQFDASVLLNTYNATFVVNDDIIQNSSVEYNITLNEIKPEDPIIEGYVFKWWSVNNVSVNDEYQIQQDTSFIAIFDNE